MKKEIGSTRCVFIFKNIVIKVARIRLKKALHYFTGEIKMELKYFKKDPFNYLKNKKKRKIKRLQFLIDFEKRKEKYYQMKLLVEKDYELESSFMFYLFAGLMANYHEYKLYIKTKNIFVMPTYFSFFGLFNIQKKGDVVNSLGSYIIYNSQNVSQPFCDNHTLTNEKNFCIDNGKLRLVDYGSRHVIEFLKLNGENLYNNFKHPD